MQSVTMQCVTQSGPAVLWIPSGITLDDLSDIEQAIALQLRVVRRALDREKAERAELLPEPRP